MEELNQSDNEIRELHKLRVVNFPQNCQTKLVNPESKYQEICMKRLDKHRHNDCKKHIKNTPKTVLQEPHLGYDENENNNRISIDRKNNSSIISNIKDKARSVLSFEIRKNGKVKHRKRSISLHNLKRTTSLRKKICANYIQESLKSWNLINGDNKNVAERTITEKGNKKIKKTIKYTSHLKNGSLFNTDKNIIFIKKPEQMLKSYDSNKKRVSLSKKNAKDNTIVDYCNADDSIKHSREHKESVRKQKAQNYEKFLTDAGIMYNSNVNNIFHKKGTKHRKRKAVPMCQNVNLTQNYQCRESIYPIVPMNTHNERSAIDLHRCSLTSLHGCKLGVSAPDVDRAKRHNFVFGIHERTLANRDHIISTRPRNELQYFNCDNVGCPSLAGPSQAAAIVNQLCLPRLNSLYQIGIIVKYIFFALLVLPCLPCLIVIAFCRKIFKSSKETDSLRACPFKNSQNCIYSTCKCNLKRNCKTIFINLCWYLLCIPLSVWRRLLKTGIFNSETTLLKIPRKTRSAAKKYTLYATKDGKWLLRRHPRNSFDGIRRQDDVIPNHLKIKHLIGTDVARRSSNMKYSDLKIRSSHYNHKQQIKVKIQTKKNERFKWCTFCQSPVQQCECKKISRFSKCMKAMRSPCGSKQRIQNKERYKLCKYHQAPVQECKCKKISRISKCIKALSSTCGSATIKMIKYLECKCVDDKPIDCCAEIGMTLIKKKRCISLYKYCPLCWHFCDGLLKCCKCSFQCIICLAAVIVWCPLCLCIYLCEELLCCIFS